MDAASQQQFVGFPKSMAWLEDEILYSYVARLHAVSCHSHVADTTLAAFGKRLRNVAHDLPSEIDAFYSRHPCSASSPQALIADRTLLTYFLFAKPAAACAAAFGALRRAGVGSLKYELGILTSRFGAAHPLKFCTACADSDLEQFGVAYWHRRHQWPGVWVCTSHEGPLGIAHFRTPTNGRFRFDLPHSFTHSNDLSEIGCHPAICLTPCAVGLAKLSDDMSREALDFPVRPEVLSRVYQRALTERDLATTGGRLRLRLFRLALFEAIAPFARMPGLRSLPASPVQAEAQFARLCRRAGGHTHSIRHLLLINWLFGGWSEFKEAYRAELCISESPTTNTQENENLRANQYDSPDCSSELLSAVVNEGLSVRQAASHHGMSVNSALIIVSRAGIPIDRKPKTILPEIKARVIEGLRAGRASSELAREFNISVTSVGRILRGEPDLQDHCLQLRKDLICKAKRKVWRRSLGWRFRWGPKIARLAVPDVYAWLYRNDREWLLHINAQAALPKLGNNNKTDWAARDRQFSEQVHRARLRFARNPQPEKHRLNFLLQRVPGLAEKRSRVDRMPLTAAAIALFLKPNIRQRDALFDAFNE